jgi:hypothetical protein
VPCTVCGVGSKRTVRECVGLGGGGTQRSWISYGINSFRSLHNQTEGGGCRKVKRKLGVFYKCVGVG